MESHIAALKGFMWDALKHPEDMSILASFSSAINQIMHVTDLMYAENGQFNLLQEAANCGLDQFVSCILSTFPSIEADWASQETPPPIFLALNNSHVQVVKVFIEHKIAHLEKPAINTVSFDCIDNSCGRNILHALPFHKQDEKSIEAAEEILMIEHPIIRSELMNVINLRDPDGHTALDYAVHSSTPDYMRMLLEFGASVTHHGEEAVILKIPPAIIENVLNSKCLKSEDLDESPVICDQLGEKVKIIANFDFLAPTDKVIGTPSADKYLWDLKQR